MSNIFHGDAFDLLPHLEPESVDMVFTSPTPGTPHLFELFDAVKRVLKPTGSLWLEMSDYHYQGGSLRCEPERLAIRMIDYGGWFLKSKCVWHRTNKSTFQESYKRFRRNWEYVYFFTKREDEKDYYFHNPDNVPLSAVLSYPYIPPRKGVFESGFPHGLIQTCIYRGCPPNGLVLDPLAGTGTTGVVAKAMGRNFIMIDHNEHAVYGMQQRLGLL